MNGAVRQQDIDAVDVEAASRNNSEVQQERIKVMAIQDVRHALGTPDLIGYRGIRLIIGDEFGALFVPPDAPAPCELPPRNRLGHHHGVGCSSVMSASVCVRLKLNTAGTGLATP